jgi:hypothetical protein
MRELNNEYLLAYNKYLVPNSEFARVHQQMIQERRQQQLAREEAAELRERVRTALAKASSRPDLDQADPLPVPTTGGSPGGGSTAPISTKPGSAAASQPLNQTLANPKGLANQNMVPQTNPNSVPQTSNTLALQARTLLGYQNSFPQTPVRVIQMVTPQPQQPNPVRGPHPARWLLQSLSPRQRPTSVSPSSRPTPSTTLATLSSPPNVGNQPRNLPKTSKKGRNFRDKNSENSDKFQCPITLLEWS